MVDYKALSATIHDVSNVAKKVPTALRIYADYSGRIGRRSEEKYKAILDSLVPANAEGLFYEMVTLLPLNSFIDKFHEALSNLTTPELAGLMLGPPVAFMIGRTLHSLYEFNKK